MSFGLGLVAGFGSAQRDYNTREHEESIAAEKAKNEATASMLHDFMLRDDVTPETRQAAVQSLMQFSQTKGIPTQKHRAAAMDSLLGTFNQPRTFVSPDVEAKRAQGHTDQSLGAGMTATAAGPAPGGGFGLPSMPAIPAFGAPGAAMTSQGDAEAATPMPGGDTRSGFLRPDEKAVASGRAMGIQTQSMYNSMGSLPGFGGVGGGSNGGASAGNGTQILMLPNGKGGVAPHIIQGSEMPRQARFFDASGQEQEGWVNYNRRTGTATDGRGQPVTPTALMTPDGWMTMTGVGSDGTPTKTVMTKSDAADAGATPQYVPKKFINVKNANNTVSTVPVSPATGRVTGPAAATGVVQTDPQLAAQNARVTSTEVGTDIKRRGFKATVDPSYGPDLPIPAGQPIVDINGTATPVGTRQFAATKQPGSVLQRASTGYVLQSQGESAAKMVEDPANADFFGKIAGRVSQLKTEGPAMFGKKMFGPIGTNDPRLTRLHGALKSISDLLTTVHGRRAEESARNFENSLAMVNSPQALAAVIRQYTSVARDVAAEAQRTIVPVTGASGGASGASGGTSGAAATHVYIPGKGAVPITSTVPSPPH